MLAMFTGTVTGGLMAVAQLSVIAEDLGVRNFQINFYFFTMAALPFALMMNTIVNGISRPMFGWLSDHIGRELVMFIAFSLEARGHPGARLVRLQPVGVRRALGHRVLRLGRGLQPVQRHRRRHVRHQEHRQDLRVALLREGHGRVAGAVREPADGSDRDLDQRALHDGGAGSQRGAGGDSHPQAAAAPSSSKPMREACRCSRRRQWRCSDACPRAYAREGVSPRLVAARRTNLRSAISSARPNSRTASLKQGRVSASLGLSACFIGSGEGERGETPARATRRMLAAQIPARSTCTSVDTVWRGRAPSVRVHRCRQWRCCALVGFLSQQSPLGSEECSAADGSYLSWSYLSGRPWLPKCWCNKHDPIVRCQRSGEFLAVNGHRMRRQDGEEGLQPRFGHNESRGTHETQSFV